METLVEVTDNGDGTYTYEQPAGDVTIAVELRESASDFDYLHWYQSIMMLYNQQFRITAFAAAGGTMTPTGVS